MKTKVLYKQLLDGTLIKKCYVVNTVKESAHCYKQRKYICEGYQQQQPIVITRCFMGFTQSPDDYTLLFYL